MAASRKCVSDFIQHEGFSGGRAGICHQDCHDMEKDEEDSLDKDGCSMENYVCARKKDLLVNGCS